MFVRAKDKNKTTPNTPKATSAPKKGFVRVQPTTPKTTGPAQKAGSFVPIFNPSNFAPKRNPAATSLMTNKKVPAKTNLQPTLDKLVKMPQNFTKEEQNPTVGEGYFLANPFPLKKNDSIPKMFAKSVGNVVTSILDAPGELLRKASIQGGSVVTGHGVQKNLPKNTTFVGDILPDKWESGLNKFEQKHPVVGGLTKNILEAGADPTMYIGGGVLDDLTKAGRIGKGSIKGTTENLIVNAKSGQNALAKLNKVKNVATESAKNELKEGGNILSPSTKKEGLKSNPVTSGMNNQVKNEGVNIVSSIDKKKPTLGQKYNRFLTATVDNTRYVGKAAGEEGKIATTAARNAGGTVEYSLKNGLVNMEGKKVVDKGVGDLFNLPKEQQNALDELLFHQHNIDRIRTGKPIFGASITSDYSKQAINNILKQYPHLQTNAQEINKTLKSLLHEWGVKSGLVSEDTENILNNMYKNYVPTYRKQSGAGAISFKTRSTGPTKIINKAVGGDDPLITLKESIPMLMNKFIKAAKKNEVYQTVLDSARKNPGNGYAEILNNAGKIEEVVNKKLSDKIFDAVENDGLYGIASMSDNALEADPKLGYLLTVMEKGKPVKLSISEDLFNSLKALDKVDDSALNVTLQKIKKYTTNPFKSLVTGYNPLFAARNIARDIPTAYIQGTENNPFKFVRNLYNAGKDMAKGTEKFQEYKALGGQGGNYFNVEKGISTEGKLSKVKKAIGAFNNATETLPRYAEYLGTLRREGDNYAGKMKGLYNAQEVTTNFGRHGDLTKSFDAVVPYLNPAVQGFDKAMRTLKNPAAWAKGLGVVTVPTVAIYMLNQAIDPNGYDKLDERTKDTYFLFPEGDGRFIKIPKTRESGTLFGALFERIARLAQGKENPFKDFSKNTAVNFLPNNPVTSNILYPLYQAAFRKNGVDFAGRNIVPTALQNYSPQYQYDAQTSEIAKTIGQKFNLSPKKIDYIIKSYTGIVGQAGLPLATKSNYSNGKGNIGRIVTAPFTADALYNNDIQNEFYNNLDKLRTQKNDAKLNGKPYNQSILDAFNYFNDQMSDLRTAIKRTEANPALSKEEKQRLSNQYQQKILDYANRANQLLK